ncbi:MAG: tetratricopeptide repeat protein, partial [Deltaproteobacteria bacterium]|nr:tetratricopeptide repeat protein [Deltaproteobacteria bacterium]
MVPQYRPAAAGLPREVLRALELQSIGNAADAEACLRDALGKHPRDARVRYILGGMLFQDKRLDEAEEILRESVKVQPSHAESWNALGAVLVALERSGEALPCFERAVKIWPDCVEARTGIGQAMSRLEKWPEAERAFVAALKIRPDFQLARHGLASALYELQRHRESLAITEDILRHSPHDMKAQRLAKQAFDALLDFTGAEVLFKDIVGRCPQSGSAWFFLSSILSDLKKLDEAVVASGKVMELWPDSGPAHLALGRSLLEKGEFAQADEHIKKCLEAAPDDFNELEALLDAFNDIQCPAALEPLCRRMLQLDPTALWAKFRLIIALELLGRGQEAAPLRKQAAQTMKPEYIFLICTAIMNQSESAQANLEHARAYAGGVLSENARKLAAGHKFKNRGQSGGRLRIGFVSHEVRNHSVASFLEPVLARLNKEEFEVFLYSSTPVVDEVSKRLIADADRFA